MAITGGRFQTLPDVTWPQDILTPPPGFGTLPPVETTNRVNVKREGFVYPFSFLDLAPTTNLSTVTSQQIQFEKSGDFWLVGMVARVFDNANAELLANGVNIGLIDNRTGYQFFTSRRFVGGNNLNLPYMPSVFFLGGVNNGVAFPQSYQQFMVPYCFLRGTTCDVVANNNMSGGGNVNIYGALIGWKEYEYVAT